MRPRLLLILGSLIGLFCFSIAAVSAQDSAPIVFHWESWDTTINVSASDQWLAITEAQRFAIESGSVRRGSRSWFDPVTVGGVTLTTPEGEQVELTAASDGEAANTYTIEKSDDETTLRYYFPTPVAAGDSFLVQINYTVPVTTRNLVDWYAVPDTHGAPINASTVQVNFIDTDPPDSGLIRVLSDNGTTTVRDRKVTIRASGALEPDEPLYIQMPFGTGVSASLGAESSGGVVAAPTSSSATSYRPAPQTNAQDELSLDNLVPFLCIFGVIVLIAASGWLNRIFGGEGGGLLGGGFGGGDGNDLTGYDGSEGDEGGGSGGGSRGGSGGGFFGGFGGGSSGYRSNRSFGSGFSSSRSNSFRSSSFGSSRSSGGFQHTSDHHRSDSHKGGGGAGLG